MQYAQLPHRLSLVCRTFELHNAARAGPSTYIARLPYNTSNVGYACFVVFPGVRANTALQLCFIVVHLPDHGLRNLTYLKYVVGSWQAQMRL